MSFDKGCLSDTTITDQYDFEFSNDLLSLHKKRIYLHCCLRIIIKFEWHNENKYIKLSDLIKL